MRSVLTISRKWHRPEIRTNIGTEGIELLISIEDFEAALLEELGNVSLIVTKGQLKKRLSKAIENVLTGVKEESAKAI